MLLHPYYKIEDISGPLYFDEFHFDAMAVYELGSKKIWAFLEVSGRPYDLFPIAS